MNQPVTFFHKRQSAEGRTYVFELESSTRTYKVFVYSRRPEAEAFQSRRLNDYQQEVSRILQAVGPGGIVVVTYENERKRPFQVLPVGQADSGFGHFGVLRPGSEMSLEEVKLDKWFETPAGSHLLVPVDQESEEQLQQMKGFLEWLPPDLESLILYSLRKPTLDARIRDLEARRSQAGGGELMNRILSWLVPALLVVLLALNVALFLRLPGKGKGSGAPPPERPAVKHDDGTPPDTPADDESSSNQEIVNVLQAIRQKAETAPVFKNLRDGSFKDLATEQDVAAALKDERAKPLALGLIKLEALRLDPAAAGLLGGEPDNRTDVKEYLRTHRPPESSGDLLAALGCAAFKTTGIPATREGRSPALMFVESGNCKDFSLDKATPGLQGLSNFVQGYSQD